MTTSISDSGVGFASGNLVNVAAAMPTTGSYVAGDLILENTTGGRVSGWRRLTTGTGNVLNTDWLYFSAGTVLGTSQNSTSGTSIDFTGIPSWAKWVTVMLNGVSTNAASTLQLQIGSGSVTTTGYTSQSWTGTTGSGVITSGFVIATSTFAAANLMMGSVTLTLIGSNTWIANGNLNFSNTTSNGYASSGNSPSLGGALDRVRLTTTGSGTDTFDAGVVNIMYG